MREREREREGTTAGVEREEGEGERERGEGHAVDRALAAFHVVGGDLEGRVLDEFAHALRASPLNLLEGFSMGPLALASTLVKVAARPLTVLQSFRLLGLHKRIVLDRATRAVPAAAEPLSRLT